MRSGFLALPAIAALAGCGGGSDDTLTLSQQYAQLRADLGSPTSATYLNSLDGTFVYTGLGEATIDNADNLPDAVFRARVEAEFGAGQDFISGQLTDFIPYGNEGNANDTTYFDEDSGLFLQRVGFVGNTASGNMNGTLRYVETDDSGVPESTSTQGVSGTYTLVFTDSSSGELAQYIDGGITGGVGESGTIGGRFVVVQQP